MRRLKDDIRMRSVPILMVPAHPGAERETHTRGADAFLAKPFEIDEFLSLVASLLARQQAEQTVANDQERNQSDLSHFT